MGRLEAQRAEGGVREGEEVLELAGTYSAPPTLTNRKS